MALVNFEAQSGELGLGDLNGKLSCLKYIRTVGQFPAAKKIRPDQSSILEVILQKGPSGKRT